MASQHVPLTPSVLRWARLEGGYSVADLATVLEVEADEVRSWEDGDGQPTRGQFSRLVELLKRPSALFFMPEPPRESSLQLALRSAPGMKRALSPGERTKVRWARAIQGAAASILAREGAPSSELPDAFLDAEPRAAGQAYRLLLGVSIERQLDWEDEYEAFRVWRSELEARGLLVLQFSMGRKGIRGFSIWHERAPVVAVNRSYLPPARIFSLFHEVGHLATRTSLACASLSGAVSRVNKIERWAEQFSSGLLIPPAAVAEFLDSESLSGNDLRSATRLAMRFKVSGRAAAVALVSDGYAPGRLYGLVNKTLGRGGNGAGGGPRESRDLKRLRELGPRTSSVLLSAGEQGLMSESEVARYLHLPAAQLPDLRDRL